MNETFEHELIAYLFADGISCMILMWLLIPLMIFPLVKSVSQAPISWLRTALRNANRRRANCLSLAYIQHPTSMNRKSEDDEEIVGSK